jgi:hypothetical protein
MMIAVEDESCRPQDWRDRGSFRPASKALRSLRRRSSLRGPIWAVRAAAYGTTWLRPPHSRPLDSEPKPEREARLATLLRPEIVQVASVRFEGNGAIFVGNVLNDRFDETGDQLVVATPAFVLGGEKVDERGVWWAAGKMETYKNSPQFRAPSRLPDRSLISTAATRRVRQVVLVRDMAAETAVGSEARTLTRTTGLEAMLRKYRAEWARGKVAA